MDVFGCLTVPKPTPSVNVHTVMELVVARPRGLSLGDRFQAGQAFRAASEDDATRVIIAAGAGAHFSAGRDLGSPDDHCLDGGIGGEVSVAPRSVWTWKCRGSVASGAPSHIVHHLE